MNLLAFFLWGKNQIVMVEKGMHVTLFSVENPCHRWLDQSIDMRFHQKCMEMWAGENDAGWLFLSKKKE